LCFCRCGVTRPRGRVGWRVSSSRASETVGGRSAGGRATSRDEVGLRPTDEARDGRRNRYDYPGAGPSHAPQVEVDGELEDFLRWLEVVL
jgi:hypothetical protein